LAYREYGFFIRLVMKRIAKKEGAPPDTSRNYEMTNWEQVDKLAREMARMDPRANSCRVTHEGLDTGGAIDEGDAKLRAQKRKGG
jgi:hypothetical protein